MPSNDEERRNGMVLAFAKANGFDAELLSEEAKDLVVQRLDMMRRAREKYTHLQRQHGPQVQPPDRYEYFAFMLDQMLPPYTTERLQMDLKFAEYNMAMADNAEEQLRPKLEVPDVGTTQQINGSKG